MRLLFPYLLICAVAMVSCTPAVDPVPVTRPQVQETATVTQRPEATPTSIQTPTTEVVLPSLTPTIQASATVLPSRTPRPSSTPTPTPTPITHYALPAWVDDPDVPVLLAEAVSEENDRDTAISLFNVLTGERWDILSNPYHASFAWKQSNGELFIWLGYPSSTAADAPGPLRVHISVPDGKINQVSPAVPGTLSHDGRSLVRSLSPGQTALFTPYESGLETEDGILLADPFNGRYIDSASVSWSPDDAYFSILRVDFPADQGGEYLYGLAIFTASGQLFRAYDGVRGQEWAPVGPPRILHSVNSAEGHQIPCLTNVVNDENRCFYNLKNWLPEPAVDIYQFRWSPDSSRISFLTYDPPALCYLELATEQVNCLVNAADFVMNDVQFYPVGHRWSEDGRYLSIFMNPNGPRSDDATNNFLAVVTAEGQDFRILGQTLSVSQTVQLWRPLLAGSQ
jgi:hypothetical protein